MSHSYRLRWLDQAVLDLRRLYVFIRFHNPSAAAKAVRRIRDAARKLRAFPLVGRVALEVEGQLFREVFVPFGQNGYWVRYAVTGKEIVIVRIWHGREER